MRVPLSVYAQMRVCVRLRVRVLVYVRVFVLRQQFNLASFSAVYLLLHCRLRRRRLHRRCHRRHFHCSCRWRPESE